MFSLVLNGESKNFHDMHHKSQDVNYFTTKHRVILVPVHKKYLTVQTWTEIDWKTQRNFVLWQQQQQITNMAVYVAFD